MKKLLVLLTAITLVLSISAFMVSAQSTSLLPEDASVWGSYAYEDANTGTTENAIVTIENGSTVIGGSKAGWPCAVYNMEEADWVTVPIEGNVLKYEFSVDTARTNIILFFKGDTPENYNGNSFTISRCFDPSFIIGTDDIMAGTYSGTIKLSDIVEHTDFPAAAKNDDDTLTISGLKIFSVGGANITIKTFEIASESEVSTTSSNESITSLEDSTASETSLDDKDNSDISSVESSVVSLDNSAETPEENNNTIWYIVGGVGVVAVVAILVFVFKKKK